jgi:hypothetical protein
MEFGVARDRGDVRPRDVKTNIVEVEARAAWHVISGAKTEGGIETYPLFLSFLLDRNRTFY